MSSSNLGSPTGESEPETKCCPAFKQTINTRWYSTLPAGHEGEHEAKSFGNITRYRWEAK